MDKRMMTCGTVVFVLFLLEGCAGSPLHPRYIRNAGDTPSVNGDSGQPVFDDNADLHLPNNLEPEHSDVSIYANDQQADQSQPLIGINNVRNNDESIGVLRNDNGDLPDLAHGAVDNINDGDEDQQENVPLEAGHTFDNNLPSLPDIRNGDEHQPSRDDYVVNADIEGQTNGEVGDGVQGTGQDDSDRVGVDIGDGENGVQVGEGRHGNTSAERESSRNETEKGKDLANGYRNTESVNVNYPNNLLSTSENTQATPSTTVSIHLHGRRNLPDDGLERNDRENGHFLLDASLVDGPTTETRIDHLNHGPGHEFGEQQRPFLLDTGLQVNNQSQASGREHETPIGTLTDAENNHGEEHPAKDNQDIDHNQQGHEHAENQNNNNENSVAGIRAVTLSHEGIVPDEEHPNAHNAPEVVLVNQNHTTTTIGHIDNEGIGHEGVDPENHEGPRLDNEKGRKNNSIIHEGVEPGVPIRTLNPLTLPHTTGNTLPGIEHATTTEGIEILPTPPIVHENTEAHEGETTSSTTTITDEHESGQPGSDIEGSGLSNGLHNTDADCHGDGEPAIVDGHETEGTGSEAESGVNSDILSNEDKHNEERNKQINCKSSTTSDLTVMQSLSTTSMHRPSNFSPHHPIEPTPIVTKSSYTTPLDSRASLNEITITNTHIQHSSSAVNSNFYHEQDFSSYMLDTSMVSEYPSNTDLFVDGYTSSSPASFSTEAVVESSELFRIPIYNSVLSSVDVYSSGQTTVLPTSVDSSEFTSTVHSRPSAASYSGRPSDHLASHVHEVTRDSDVSIVSATQTGYSVPPESGVQWADIRPSTSAPFVSSSATMSLNSRSTTMSTTVSTDIPESTSAHTPTSSSLPSNNVPLVEFSITTTPPSTAPNTRSQAYISIVPFSTKMKLPDSTTTTTTVPTTKKRVTIKATEKPEDVSTATAPSASGPPIGVPSSGAFVTLPPIQAQITTKGLPPLTTPPQVFVQIWIRMSSCQFYSQKPVFITELQRLIVSEKQVALENEQFVVIMQDVPEEYCKDVPNEIVAGSETLGQIKVEMYIKDKKGNTDIVLTYAVSNVIRKGFQEATSAFKDKIVRVDVQNVQDVFRTRPATDDGFRSTEEHASVAMVIVLGTVGGCCCIILVILQVILIHRRVTTKKKASYMARRVSICSLDHVALGVIPKSRPNSGYWNPALNDIDELCVGKHSHLLNFPELANFCINDAPIYDEFQTIPCEKPDSSVVPIGEDDKNRFVNVIPYKHTRVKLRMRPRDVSDYINANYVSGYQGNQRAYIATQSPLVNTVEDFWRMVWEQQSRVILMLNPLTSSGKPKQSTCYWPDDMTTDVRRLYGDFSVTLKKREVHPDYIECTLELFDLEGNLKREVRHFWLTCWPETNTMEPLKLVKFILDSRPHYENSGAPAVVHCGPGQGRTGVLIAVDVGMRRFENKRRVDVLDCVNKMRKERAGAVQNKEQYALIYQSLNEYAVLLSSPSLSTRSSIITLHAML